MGFFGLIRIGILLALVACTACAHAQAGPEPADFAVLSIVGDRLAIAGPETDVRRHDKRGAEVVVAERTIDAAALAAAERAIKTHDARARVALLVTREPAVFAAQEQVLDLSSRTATLLEALEPVLARVRARRLVLISKIRHEARMRFENVHVDKHGFLEGLGFYVESGSRIQNVKTFEIAYGYLGVFAYFRVSLVDLASRRVVAEEDVLGSRTLRDPSKEPWDAISAEVKVAAMKDLLQAEIAAAVERLLSSNPTNP